jgi:transcriptional regulator with XRE-family HTH domain
VPHVTEAENEGPIGPESEASQDPGVIAKKLQFLFETVRKPDGKKYTYREVLDGVVANGGPTLSIGYLSQLVNGVRKNPMLDALTAIAAFFKVPLSFFDITTGTTEADARMKLAARLQSAGVESIAQRAAGLNQGNLKALETLIDQMRTMQGLPPVEPEPGGSDG